MPHLAALAVADPAELWRELGFDVAADGVVAVGPTRIGLDWAGHGITGWRLDGAPSAIDGLTEAGPAPVVVDAPAGGAAAEGAQRPHPNGVVAVDHVVVATPDLTRTLDALAAAGLALRRTRQAGGGESGQIRTQAFYLLGRTVLEVVGPAEGARPGPAHLWGVTFTVADLGATLGRMGDLLGTPRDAVQPGRRIVTLRRSAGSSVPMAFMSPHRPSLGDEALSPGDG